MNTILIVEDDVALSKGIVLDLKDDNFSFSFEKMEFLKNNHLIVAIGNIVTISRRRYTKPWLRSLQL